MVLSTLYSEKIPNHRLGSSTWLIDLVSGRTASVLYSHYGLQLKLLMGGCMMAEVVLPVEVRDTSYDRSHLILYH